MNIVRLAIELPCGCVIEHGVAESDITKPLAALFEAASTSLQYYMEAATKNHVCSPPPISSEI